MFSSRFTKLALITLFTLAVVFAAAGCGGPQVGAPQEGGKDGSTGLSGTIQIAGSTSVQPLSEELAQAFMSKHPQVKVNVAGGGSGAGVKSAQQGTADIGAASRNLKPGEKGTVKVTTIAYDGIAVVVHPSNPVSEIKMEDIPKIWGGEITNWKDLGGKDAPITVYSREEGSGTRGAFTEIAIGETVEVIPHAIIQNSNGAMRTAVSGDPNGIGYISFGYLNDEVKALKIDGVEPTVENVKANKYKISRPFNYLTKDEPSGLVKEYIDFVLSDEGQSIVAKDFIRVD